MSPDEEARRIQNNLRYYNIPPAVAHTVQDDLKLSAPETVSPVTAVSGIASAQQEELIRTINFKKLKAANLSPAVARFDELIATNYPWLNNSINNPTVANAYKKPDGKGDITKLFYIDGLTVDEYLSKNMSDYSKYPAAEKEYLGKAAVMNALVTGAHAVDKQKCASPDYIRSKRNKKVSYNR